MELTLRKIMVAVAVLCELVAVLMVTTTFGFVDSGGSAFAFLAAGLALFFTSTL